MFIKEVKKIATSQRSALVQVLVVRYSSYDCIQIPLNFTWLARFTIQANFRRINL